MVARRAFLRRSAVAIASLAAAPLLPSRGPAHAAPLAQATGPLVPDPNQVLDLPNGFSYTVLIRSGQVLDDGSVFRPDPDLGAVVPVGDGTYYLVIGHEIRADLEYGGEFTGGLTRLHLAADGTLLNSSTLSDGTRNNCSGVATPWGTVLSGEESPRSPYESYPDEGYMWEVDPKTGTKTRRDLLGRYSHESAAIHPATGELYLTADIRGGAFFKFVPTSPGDLSAGTLLALNAAERRWIPIENPYQANEEALAKGATRFNRDEDLEWGIDGNLYICETGNTEGPTANRDLFGRLRRFDPRTNETSVFVEGGLKTIIMPDNITVDREGNLFVCEDKSQPMTELTGNNNIARVTPDGQVTVFATMWRGMEPAGVVFSPDYKTLYVNVLEPEGAVLAVRGF